MGMKPIVHDPRLTPYDEHWRQHRRHNRAVLLLWLGWLPFGGLVVSPAMQVTGSENFGFALAGAWMLAFLTSGARAGNFRCPRCGKQFFSKSWYHNGWSAKCLHCGLPKGSGSKRRPLDSPATPRGWRSAD